MQRLKRVIIQLLIAGLALSLVPVLPASAAQITSRSLTLGTSAGNTPSTWTFHFTVPTNTALKSVRFQVCTSAALTCTVPTGWTNAGASLASTTNIGPGWSIDLATNSDSLGITNAGNTTSSGTPVNVVFNNVTNPNTTNTTFFVRISTYSNSTYSTLVDKGTVTASTSQQIFLTGIMPESLVFCTGLTFTTANDCSTISGSTVDFGLFSPTYAAAGNSMMAASTNAGFGYVITVLGTTLTSGANTITANTVAAASVHGSSQFGMNVVANTINVDVFSGGSMVPQSGFGAAISGPGANGTAASGYGTADSFQYNSGDPVANSNSLSSDTNTYTVSYLVNVPGNQPAGTYTTTLTYICTATY